MRWGFPRRARAPAAAVGDLQRMPSERLRSPGLGVALAGLPEDGGGRILDMSASSVVNLDQLMVVAHHVRVVDSLQPNDSRWSQLMPQVDSGEVIGDLEPVVAELFPDEWGPFDVVLAWDLLNYLTVEGVTALAQRLAGLCSPEAKLFAQVVAVGDMAALPARYRIVASDQIEVSTATAARRSAPGWPFAKFERLLSGFEVECSFIMRHGVQEYVAVRT
ncbi:MAG: hypothetical protein GY906_03935 [bacterium]|nr:hypothetical protein [bacterium]